MSPKNIRTIHIAVAVHIFRMLVPGFAVRREGDALEERWRLIDDRDGGVLRF